MIMRPSRMSAAASGMEANAIICVVDFGFAIF
jgi:hypothetical protein